MSYSLTGASELAAALDRLGRAANEEVLEAALTQAAVPLADEMRRLAPPGDGGPKPLAESISIRKTLKRSQMRGRVRKFAEVFIGPTAPHGHLVEFGHKLVKVRHTSKGYSRRTIGRVAGHPFIRPAFDMGRGQIGHDFGRAVWEELLRKPELWQRQIARGRLSASAAETFGVSRG